MLPTDRRRHLRLPIIDRCLRTPASRWTASKLLEEVNAYLEECEQAPVTIRSIQKDLQYLKALPHNPAPIAWKDEGRYRYYYYEDRDYELEAPAINQDQLFALELSHAVLEQLKGFPMVVELVHLRRQLERQVIQTRSGQYPTMLFDQNVHLKGVEWLEPLFDAIKNETVLHLIYQPFGSESIEKVIHPWWLKQSNNRWFLFGWDAQNNRLDNSPLDRIEKIAPRTEAYLPNTSIDPISYFAPMVGVTRYPKDQPQCIVIRIKESRGYYIRTKLLHASQVELAPKQGYCVFQYNVIINKEWISMLLSFGADLEVLEPASLRDQMKQEANDLIKKYNR